jgi:hypothetical protein
MRKKILTPSRPSLQYRKSAILERGKPETEDWTALCAAKRHLQLCFADHFQNRPFCDFEEGLRTFSIDTA